VSRVVSMKKTNNHLYGWREEAKKEIEIETRFKKEKD
jgi:hypothetical protein